MQQLFGSSGLWLLRNQLGYFYGSQESKNLSQVSLDFCTRPPNLADIIINRLDFLFYDQETSLCSQ